jgi:hypothetical protein
MYWCRGVKKIIPSHGRGAADCEMAGRSNNASGKTPTSSFPREGIAHIPTLLFTLLLISLLPSCKPDNLQNGVAPEYFDLQGYFKADTARLNKLNPLTLKTVTHNGITESKKVHIKNWGLELNSFSGSDINKPAWKDSYQVQNIGDTLIYKAKYPELKTRRIIIIKQNNKIKQLLIDNSTQNLLYKTSEKLSYFPDSIYVIEKVQQVKLMGTNRYTVRGTLN